MSALLSLLSLIILSDIDCNHMITHIILVWRAIVGRFETLVIEITLLVHNTNAFITRRKLIVDFQYTRLEGNTDFKAKHETN